MDEKNGHYCYVMVIVFNDDRSVISVCHDGYFQNSSRYMAMAFILTDILKITAVISTVRVIILTLTTIIP